MMYFYFIQLKLSPHHLFVFFVFFVFYSSEKVKRGGGGYCKVRYAMLYFIQFLLRN